MITIKKGQTVDFRSPRVPCYIKETKEAAGELARNLISTKEMNSRVNQVLAHTPKKSVKQKKVLTPFPILWNKLKKERNAIHQEG